ncbi:hypothetical protein [Bradyrhizobium sp. Arg816]|uniref:hypothetical protein n=1 Tax=Bradyrhizobium sp. Arg816 TaxID=2998491 RepID=UPI00249D8D32|nr:hypothetical protein [Bradyrhizobium sp. Arg816]MDI3567230.1 hypothetical protein [Bradyrhizobium sp. Arg816]
MSVKSIVAGILREELASLGIRSLTTEEAETIAARIFERITDLDLAIAARDIASVSRVDKVTRPVAVSVYDPLCQWLLSTRGQAVRLTFSEIEEILGGRYLLLPTASVHGGEMKARARLVTRRPLRG